MHTPMRFFFAAIALPALVLVSRTHAATAPGQGPAAQAAKSPKPAFEVASVHEIPKSCFSRDGKNPFFPDSAPDKRSRGLSTNNVAQVAVFVLNGISSPPKRTAIINNRTFEPGEEGEVKIDGGSRVLVKCLEIKDDGAVILVSGQRRELKLRIF